MSAFPSIRIEGGLLGPDILEHLVAGDLPGQKPSDFGLDDRQSLTDEIAAVFADARAQWEAFRRRLARLPESDPATSVTRDAWVIPFFSLLGYELRYNQRAYDVDGMTFAISHRAGDSDDAPPVHIVGARQELGRAAPTGRPRLAPHALVQEFLNRTERLWGVVTNGEVVRVLRDSTYIRRQAYVEFDLRHIFEDQRFHDFAALYRLLHRTRLPHGGGAADARACWLERYYQHGLEQGDRVRERLRDGVEAAITRLANGFLSHPRNSALRARLARGTQGGASAFLAPAGGAGAPLTPQDVYRQLLRLVYRFLFLLVSEERGLIGAAALYREHYGVTRLRRALERRSAATEDDDLWCSLTVLWYVLADERLAALLGVAPLNGDLFEPIDLDACAITNRDLLDAFWHLAYYRDTPGSPPRRVNYAALDVEELGSVYESLLDYHPQIIADGAALRFELAYGSERKATGSYYTPPDLVGALIRATLDPVIAERLAPARTAAEKVQAILAIRVLDPACGSGHFLLAAARRLGKELARIRTGEDEPAPEQVRVALRDVVAHCIYGVDKNPLAVELARVALWIESHAEGKPLTFLDHRITCGDSLVGLTDLAALEDGIPDEAFAPVSADDKGIAGGLKRQNRKEASGQTTLFGAFDPVAAVAALGAEAATIDRIGDDTPSAVRDKKRRFQELQQKTKRQRTACNLWTAAFFQARRADAPPASLITTDTVRAWLATQTAHPQAVATAEVLAAQHGFFHWPLAFPDVFAKGGFDVALGNPPWERIKLQEQEFFAACDPEIARAPTAAVRDKKRRFQELQQKTKRQRTACNLWTAAFVQARRADTLSVSFITTDTVRAWLATQTAHPQAVAAAEALAAQHGFFHWPLAFPEVFARGGFDVVLGNPPFMGGLKISGVLGAHYRRWLEVTLAPYAGTADLCAAFLRRAFDLLRPGGYLGLVATNTIGQGDTRESGLKVILQRGGVIHFAQRFIKWPGQANVEVNLVALQKPFAPTTRAPASERLLDSQPVTFISSRLDAEPEVEPMRLRRNEGRAFIGDIVRGIGFVLEPAEAEQLLEIDPRNADCLFPYLNGEDLNSHPSQQPSRWVICFHDWDLARARTYPDLLAIVERRVKPERERLTGPGDRRNRAYWWQFGAYRAGMRHAIAPLRRVLARAEVSRMHIVSFVPKGWMYSHMLIVFAFDDDYHFALLQSAVHETWTWRNASSLASRNRYTPTDCFDTFPFPPAEYAEPNLGTLLCRPAFARAAQLGAAYHAHRQHAMLARRIGLTKTYNLFHNPTCTDDDIQRLRELHAAMDQAVLACYGWEDIDLGYAFAPNDRGQTRFMPSVAARRELLFRLTKLNAQMAQEERQ